MEKNIGREGGMGREEYGGERGWEREAGWQGGKEWEEVGMGKRGERTVKQRGRESERYESYEVRHSYAV